MASLISATCFHSSCDLEHVRIARVDRLIQANLHLPAPDDVVPREEPLLISSGHVAEQLVSRTEILGKRFREHRRARGE